MDDEDIGNTGFERSIMLDTLGRAPLEESFEASGAERELLANRFDLLAVESFTGRYEILRQDDGSVVVDGSFSADVVQACVRSLAPVPDHIADSFCVRFVPGLVPEPIDEDDLESLVDMEDQEPLEGDSIPVGEIVAQYLALSLNPYPRLEGASVAPLSGGNVRLMTEEEAQEDAKLAPSPFDALKKLKDGA